MRTSSVLPSPGTPSSSTWPPAIKRGQRFLDDVGEADDHLAHLAPQQFKVGPEPVELLPDFVGRAGFSHRGDSSLGYKTFGDPFL